MLATEKNREKYQALNQELQNSCETNLKKGFYGSITVKIKIQDGSIQDFDLNIEKKYK